MTRPARADRGDGRVITNSDEAVADNHANWQG